MQDRAPGHWKEFIRTLDTVRDLASANLPGEYRGGIVIGTAIACIGGVFAVVGILTSLTDRASAFHEILGMLTMPLILVAVGVLLIRRAKLGLWGVYFLSVCFGLFFLMTAGAAIFSDAHGAVITAIVELAMLMIWWPMAKYFYVRRRQFTRLWGG